MITAVQDGAAILYHNGNPKIATTAAGAEITGGLITTGTTNTFTHGTAWGTNLKLTNTNNDSSPPIITFLKAPAGGHTQVADNDYVGFINFRADNSNNDEFSWVELSAIANDITDGSEDSTFRIGTYGAGTEYGNTLVAASGNVGIGTGSPLALLHINGTGDAVRVTSTNTGSGGAQVDLLQYTTSPADNDIHGMINFGGYYSGTNAAYGSSIRSVWSDVSAKEAQLEFFTRDDSDFAARMTIDKDGNVGVGTGAPSAHLTVFDTASPQISLDYSGGSNNGGSINFNLIHAGVPDALTTQIKVIDDGAYRQHLTFLTKTSGAASSGMTERMRIDSSGRVGIAQDTPGDFHASADDLVIGNSSGNRGLTIRSGSSDEGAIFFADGVSGNEQYRGSIQYQHSSDSMIFGTTGGTERMRITNDGTVLFDKTSTNVNVVGGYILGGEAIMSTPAGTNTYLVRNTSNSTYSFYVGGDGEVHSAQGTAMTNLSDERLKENIKPLETGLDTIMKLKPRRFDWKEGEGSGKKNLAGFIAQEVETVLPDLVGEYLHDELEDAKSVRTGDMIPTLVKAIQELKAEIDELKS
jgi:hypothetical protein